MDKQAIVYGGEWVFELYGKNNMFIIYADIKVKAPMVAKELF